ncbi:hypothetical protein HAX54_024198 [Datura stramonium]|uniref:Uncharacterized protein n=1 Tax=Datura stramonium TaxID=4076 RepID=A0ABS8UZ18_DATST|nr:hypothetical protein [Datura stramonium]
MVPSQTNCLEGIPLICGIFREWHMIDRAFRQFGMEQDISEPVNFQMEHFRIDKRFVITVERQQYLKNKMVYNSFTSYHRNSGPQCSKEISTCWWEAGGNAAQGFRLNFDLDYTLPTEYNDPPVVSERRRQCTTGARAGA